jgi:AcrR family transcriptional regulator
VTTTRPTPTDVPDPGLAKRKVAYPRAVATTTGTASNWRVYGDHTLSRPLAAALSAFAEHGYHGSTIREVASKAGLSVPGLYHYYPSKQALLIGLMTEVMNELLERSRAALQSAGPTPQAQFDALVECLVLFHMYRRDQAFVASTEIRSMEKRNRTKYIGMRDQQQHMLEEVIERGREQGVFATPYAHDAARAVSSLCVAVSSWYHPGGGLDPAEIVRRYISFARGLVGVRTANDAEAPAEAQ